MAQNFVTLNVASGTWSNVIPDKRATINTGGNLYQHRSLVETELGEVDFSPGSGVMVVGSDLWMGPTTGPSGY